MIRSIATVSMSGTLRDKIAAAAACGYEGIEIFENDLVYHPGPPEEVRGLAEAAGLRIVALQPLRDVEGLDGEAREKALRRARRTFELARRLGTDLVLVCSQTRADADGSMDRIVRDLRGLADLAAGYGLRLAYEALAWGRHVNTWTRAYEVVELVERPNFGLALDTFHMLVREPALDRLARLDPARVFLLQLADAPDVRMDPLFLSRHFRCFPGQGDLPVVEVVRPLLDAGYAGPASHEIFSDDFRAASPQQAALDGLRSFLFLEERTGRGRMPPAPAPRGFGFVEFAADPADAPALRGLLTALGFRRTRRHRSKRVELWSQGDAHILIDLEDEGFFHAFHLLHGLSVAALALDVGDPAAVAERARAARAVFFRGPRGEGELELAAVRGVAGSLLYLLGPLPDGRGWREVDFLPEEAPVGGEPLGITAVDHVAQVVPAAEFASWVLFYRVVLGLEPERRVEIVDPRGAIASRALSDPARHVRIVLNASASATSAAGRFLARTAGAGAQHVALACGDVLAAAERIPAELRLPVPDNYYDELESRFDLDPGFAARLRRARVFYDRDDGGEFLHLYTRPLEGFFFELVERRGGYDRYGEPNAPVRLAALAEIEASPSERLTRLFGGG